MTTAASSDPADRQERADLQARLADAEAALLAIRSGAVDAITVDTPAGPWIYTLQGAEQPYRYMVESMTEGALAVRPDGIILYCNQRFADMLKSGLPTLIGTPLPERFHGDDAAALAAALRASETTATRLPAALLASDGSQVPVTVAVHRQSGGAAKRIAIVIADLTEQQRAETARDRAIREQRVLIACNAILAHATDEPRMLADICNVIADATSYSSVWIGYAADDDPNTIRPVAGTGDAVNHTGPVATAVRTGETIIARNTDAAPESQPGQDKGCRSSASLPLRADHSSFGVLTVSSPQPDAFDDQELHFLAELADNLAFGIVSLRARQENERLAAIVESAGEAIVGRDLTGTITAWNRAAERMFGYTAAEIIGRPSETLVPREIAGEALWLFEKVCRDEAVEQFDTIRLTKNRRRIAVSLTYSPVRDRAGNVVAAAILMHDNTLRRNAEEAMRFRERLLLAETAKLRSILDSMAEGVIVAATDGTIIEANPAARSSHGIDVIEQGVGRTLEGWFSQVKPCVPDGVTPLPYDMLPLVCAFRGEDTNDAEVWIRKSDGSRHLMQVNGRPIHAEDGSVSGGVAVFSDITDRRRAEETIRRQADQYATLLSASPDGYTLVDSDGTLLDVNDAYCRMSGYTRDELLALHTADLDAVKTPEQTAAHIRQVLEAGFEQFESRHRRKDGTVFDVEVSLVVWRATDQLVGFIRDISARKDTEAELLRYRQNLEGLVAARTADLEHANQALADANKELESFAYSVSHDLRAPLRAIDGFSQILLDDYSDRLDAEGKRLLGVVRNGAIRMAQLIDDILAFARISRRNLAESDTDMAALVQETLNELAPAMAGRSIDMQIGPLPHVRGDAEMLRRVWVNLLDNAIKFTGRTADARIEVGARAENDEIVFFVRDNGAGFDMQYAGKLFGMFQRLHGPEIFPGNGIGLAIVKRIVVRHGGRIWAEGKPEEGATFFFALPAGESSHV